MRGPITREEKNAKGKFYKKGIPERKTNERIAEKGGRRKGRQLKTEASPVFPGGKS